jgi:hypothetical protein
MEGCFLKGGPKAYWMEVGTRLEEYRLVFVQVVGDRLI